MKANLRKVVRWKQLDFGDFGTSDGPKPVANESIGKGRGKEKRKDIPGLLSQGVIAPPSSFSPSVTQGLRARPADQAGVDDSGGKLSR